VSKLKIEFTPADYEAITFNTCKLLFQKLRDRGIEADQAGEIVKRVEDNLWKFLRAELEGIDPP
jgi:hypothetical protein